MKPIGVFDSGLGGVSFLREAVKKLPNESFIYYGDNKNAPYGDKSEEEIERLALGCTEFLMEKGVKAIVVACNTATGSAINLILERVELPVLSVEPAIKPPSDIGGQGKILMLATAATTKMARYHELKSRMKEPSRIIDVPCSGIADIIENGVFDPKAYETILDEKLSGYKGMEIDAIVLGCTHYIFISEAISEYAARNFKGSCTIYDGNEGTARRLRHVLEEKNMRELGSERGSVTFYTSGDYEKYKRIFDMLMARQY